MGMAKRQFPDGSLGIRQPRSHKSFIYIEIMPTRQWQGDCRYLSCQAAARKGAKMKLVIGVVALILLFSMPAHAQAAYGNSIGGGGSLNSGSSLGGGSGYHGVTFHHSISSGPITQFHMTVVTGDGNQFIPSTYVPFSKAVELGRTMEIAKPKTLAEVASEYRSAKKDKPEATSSRIFEEQGTGREQ